MKYIYFLLCALGFSGAILAQTVTPIYSLRQNDSNGVPVDTSKLFSISGVVIASSQLGTNGPAAVMDKTGAVSVYGSKFASTVQIGDSVTVYSKLTHYNGLTQLSFPAYAYSRFTKLKSSSNFDTLTLTASMINNQQWNGYEEYESRLVRLNNVTISAAGNFAGNSSYTISDATGNMTLYIDRDVASVAGTPIPAKSFDIIGILGQYSTSAPYKNGYQIIPRMFSDILSDGKPLILVPVVASAIDTSGFTVYFSTARKGSGMLKYGLTSLLEIDSVLTDSLSTFHKIRVSGLKPLTKYFYKVISENEFGKSESSIYSVTTAPAVSGNGEINVYFSTGVDTSIALKGNKANGNVNFQEKLVQRINAAVYSVDMAVYSFSGVSNIAGALIAAKDRGVKIRVVYDSRTVQNSMQLLINSGIKIIQRPADNAIMHNKFFIFDARDNNDDNDWLWTGSWNPTSNETNWKNNVVEISDHSIALAYTTEFEEMWGSRNDEPDRTAARFGPGKSDNTPHNFRIGGSNIKLFFSPSDNTESEIINQISAADSSVYFSLLTFTSDGIFQSLKNKFNNGAKDIRGIIDNVTDNGSEFVQLKQFGDIFDYVSTDTVFHHKYAIIDALYKSCDPVVITGSHNWSKSANQENDENTLIIENSLIANQYLQEFKKRYNELGGKLKFTIPESVSVTDEAEDKIPENVKLYQNYPNPFNPVTTISFTLNKDCFTELAVFNILGQRVATIIKGQMRKGKTVVDFDSGNLPSGIYVYNIKTASFSQSKKFILLK